MLSHWVCRQIIYQPFVSHSQASSDEMNIWHSPMDTTCDIYLLDAQQPSANLGSMDVEIEPLDDLPPSKIYDCDPSRIWNTTFDWTLQYAVPSLPQNSGYLDHQQYTFSQFPVQGESIVYKSSGICTTTHDWSLQHTSPSRPQDRGYFGYEQHNFSHTPVHGEPTDCPLGYTYGQCREPTPSRFLSPPDSELRTPMHTTWDTAKSESSDEQSLLPVECLYAVDIKSAETVASDHGKDDDKANDFEPCGNLRRPGTPHPASISLLDGFDGSMGLQMVDTTSSGILSGNDHAIQLDGSNVVKAEARIRPEQSMAETEASTSIHETSSASKDGVPHGDSGPSFSNTDTASYNDQALAPFVREGTEPLEEGESQAPAVFLGPGASDGDSCSAPSTDPHIQAPDPHTTGVVSRADTIPEVHLTPSPVLPSDPSAPRPQFRNPDDCHSKRVLRRPGTNSRSSLAVINDAKRMVAKKESLEQAQAHIHARKRALFQSQMRTVRPLPKRALDDPPSQLTVPRQALTPVSMIHDNDDDDPRPDRSDRKKKIRFSDSQSSSSACQILPTLQLRTNKVRSAQVSSRTSSRKPLRSILKNRNSGTSMHRQQPVTEPLPEARSSAAQGLSSAIFYNSQPAARPSSGPLHDATSGSPTGSTGLAVSTFSGSQPVASPSSGSSCNHSIFGTSQRSHRIASIWGSEPVAGPSARLSSDARFGARSHSTLRLSSHPPSQAMFGVHQQTHIKDRAWISIRPDPESEEESHKGAQRRR
ncbi:hypothetical protein PAXRUDRAFT_729752 [Paxillus rubicundulus Ve08.2h10]|uniref:Uncharacterized protein n=1 Tax=Paxillus rubicundulus Ve08.2h10 TaxID=930991 RepID=A0A0D0DUL4_9AGAM|nr:hypothetical protein PAXRUDRAFT_729752 [Paxillus rubicundulus Ve08.2h10]